MDVPFFGMIKLDAWLLLFLGLNFLAALSGAFFMPRAWYRALKKPDWQPPDWLFGPVWTLLYVMIAVSGWLVFSTAAPGALTLPMVIYGVQLVLNALWSAIFFGMRRIGLALIECLLLWASVAATILAFAPIHGTAALLLLPYLAWVSFACFLNWTIVRLNPGPFLGIRMA